MKYLFTFLSILGASFLTGQTLSQLSSTEGFSITGNIGYTSWNSDEFTGEALGGFAFAVSPAYGFNDYIQAFINLEFAPSVESGTPDIDSYPTRQIELGARFNFGATTSAWRPFLQASVSNHSLTYTDFFNYDVNLSGILLGVGGGVNYFFNPAMAAQVKYNYDFGTHDSNKVDGLEWDSEFDVNTSRFMFGFVYLFE